MDKDCVVDNSTDKGKLQSYIVMVCVDFIFRGNLEVL